MNSDIVIVIYPRERFQAWHLFVSCCCGGAVYEYTKDLRNYPEDT
jgi:hypothetical protein